MDDDDEDFLNYKFAGTIKILLTEHGKNISEIESLTFLQVNELFGSKNKTQGYNVGRGRKPLPEALEKIGVPKKFEELPENVQAAINQLRK